MEKFEILTDRIELEIDKIGSMLQIAEPNYYNELKDVGCFLLVGNERDKDDIDNREEYLLGRMISELKSRSALATLRTMKGVINFGGVPSPEFNLERVLKEIFFYWDGDLNKKTKRYPKCEYFRKLIDLNQEVSSQEISEPLPEMYYHEVYSSLHDLKLKLMFFIPFFATYYHIDDGPFSNGYDALFYGGVTFITIILGISILHAYFWPVRNAYNNLKSKRGYIEDLLQSVYEKKLEKYELLWQISQYLFDPNKLDTLYKNLFEKYPIPK